MADFVREDQLHQFVHDGLGQLHVPSLRVCRAALGEIPELQQVGNGTEDAYVTGFHFARAGQARSRAVGIGLP